MDDESIPKFKTKFLFDLKLYSYITSTEKGTGGNFCIFNSIENILYLIYVTENKSIIFYNLLKNNKINEIKKAHKFDITTMLHYLDKKNKSDLILTLASRGLELKLWKLKNLECLLSFYPVYPKGWLQSACFFSDNSKIFIGLCIESGNCPVKILDIETKQFSDLKDSERYNAQCIDKYYENDLIYIIVAFFNNIRSYNYKNNHKEYKLYKDNKDNFLSNDILINKINLKEIVLISADFNGYLRIFNFHSSELLKKIQVYNNLSLDSISLLNEQYLYILSFNGIELIDYKNGKIMENNLPNNKDKTERIKIIKLPNFETCLIAQIAWSFNHCFRFWKIESLSQ